MEMTHYDAKEEKKEESGEKVEPIKPGDPRSCSQKGLIARYLLHYE